MPAIRSEMATPRVSSVLTVFLSLLSLVNASPASSPPDNDFGKGHGSGPGSKPTKPKGLAGIEHLVIFMQENRSLDHLHGCMAGVRGFNDANLQFNDGRPVWDQVTDPRETDAEYLRPWYVNYLGGNYSEATECMLSGSNSWQENHIAWNGGRLDRWALNNTPSSIAFVTRKEAPIHWALAESYLVGDMYQESVVAATNPNRVFWLSGSVNAPGGPQTPDQGGNPYIDNNITPGCEKGGFNCYPLKWKTIGEYYEDAGVDWMVFQDEDNFDDNAYARFEQFQNAPPDSSLYKRGIKGQSLQTFYDRAANGTLPEVSYIVAAMELSEHPPASLSDGAWLQYQVATAVINGPKYSSSVLINSYDEVGGWSDHVDPYRSPDGTPGEWIDDPYGLVGRTWIGPGYRLPFWIVSPWTRKGGVYTSHADHTSQILFIEEWQKAKGRDVVTKEMVQWRREHMSNLVDAFDFENPDYSIPNIPLPREPHKDSKGNYDGSAICESRYPNRNPAPPYEGRGVIKDMASVVEKGFKEVRGQLTEGRWLTFEMNGLALTQVLGQFAGVSFASRNHDAITQRWVVHAVEIGKTDFRISTAKGGLWLCGAGVLCKDKNKAMVVTITFYPSQGYAIQGKGTSQFLSAESEKDGFSMKSEVGHWSIFSVNY